MNEKHLELCSGAEWAEAVRRWIIPWVLDGLDLGDDVLEVGPGPGRTTEVLADLVPRLTGIEIDPALAASLAHRMAASGVQVVQGDATSLPWEGGRFSAVLSFTMLHHLPSPASQDRLFAEAARVLRPGGVLAGTDSLDSAEFRELHEGDICVPVAPAGLAGRLKEAGFSQAQVQTNDYGVRFRAWPGRTAANRTPPAIPRDELAEAQADLIVGDGSPRRRTRTTSKPRCAAVRPARCSAALEGSCLIYPRALLQRLSRADDDPRAQTG